VLQFHLKEGVGWNIKKGNLTVTVKDLQEDTCIAYFIQSGTQSKFHKTVETRSTALDGFLPLVWNPLPRRHEARVSTCCLPVSSRRLSGPLAWGPEAGRRQGLLSGGGGPQKKAAGYTWWVG